MPLDSLSVSQTAAMFEFVADQIEQQATVLNEADRVIGDGDHGEAMARGLRAARERLQTDEFDSIGAVLKLVGMRMMATMGGASGAIFGTWFRSGGKPLEGVTEFNGDALAMMLEEGAAGVQARGKAQLGDKTMLDALIPAARAARDAAHESLPVAFRAAANTAREGVEKTRSLVARLGRARSLGERSIGQPDPGALSTAMILGAMAEYVEQEASISRQNGM